MSLSRGGQRVRKIGARTLLIGGLLLAAAVIVTTTGCNGDSSSAPSSSAATSSTLSISGTPATQAAIGQTYSFRPVVSDSAAPAAVGFSIQNKPMWATFNTSSGQLAGTPASADVGSYPGIVISASTAGAQASLTGFTITVLQKGTVVLSWEAPTTNTDGSPLTDIAGYIVHYGTIASLLTQSAALDTATDGYSLSALAPGIWYFAISATNSAGVEGAWSDVVSATVN